VSFWVGGKRFRKSAGCKSIQDAKPTAGQESQRPNCGLCRKRRVPNSSTIFSPTTKRDAHVEKRRVYRWCIDANVRPFFGEMKAAAVTTQKLKQYRDKRKADGVKEATCNRELSIAKVASVPYFPMVHEDNAQAFSATSNTRKFETLCRIM
jgi:hypothetical protein